MNQDPEDEWEYIFDDNETETFTLTIDLSATASGADTVATSKPSEKHDEQNEAATAPLPYPAPTTTDAIRDAKSSIQFLDLPSKAPYISYKGQVFVGTWGQTLGSDLIFAATNDLPDSIKPVLQDQDDQWCLLGVSNTTLVAKPVELVKRTTFQTQPLPASTPRFLAPDTQGSNTQNVTQQAKPFSVVLQPDADPRQQRQAAFLEQLMAVKIAKGEKDVVYLGRATRYRDAAGKVKQGAYLSKRGAEEIYGDQDDDTNSRTKKKRRIEAPPSQDLSVQDLQIDGVEGDDIDDGIQDATGREPQEQQDTIGGELGIDNEAENDPENQAGVSEIDSGNEGT